jgi:glyoxylase-like metal-dependent hydrolase (beta-lactamase superfamily II)
MKSIQSLKFSLLVLAFSSSMVAEDTPSTTKSVAVPAAATSVDPFVPVFEELAPGVWVGRREDSLRFPVMGTTTFVISEEGVVVFDGGGVPLMSERVLAKIRELTDRPVTHIVISHWHGDHNFGIGVIREAFPAVQIVAHNFTRAAMLGAPMRYIESQPDLVDKNAPRLRAVLEAGKESDGSPLTDDRAAGYREMLEYADLIDQEYERLQVNVPNMTFDKTLTIHSGSRWIELLHLGAGNTAGDVVMWLPEPRIVATGDLVVAPTPYGFNVPPRAWAATLGRVQDLGYEILVPGHGAVQRDPSYVDLLIEVADSVADQRDALLAEGLDAKAAQEKIDISEFEPRFTAGDPRLTRYFKNYFTDPFRKAAFKALTGEPMVRVDVPRDDGT